MNEMTLTAGLLSLLATAGLASAPAETPAGQAQTAAPLAPRAETQQEQYASAEDARRLLDAAARGDVTRLRQLLASGVSANARDPEDPQTPLYAAAEGGFVACVEALLKAGARVNEEVWWGIPVPRRRSSAS